MKRVLSVVISGLFLAGFVACTKKEEPKPSEPTLAPPAANQAPDQAPPPTAEQPPGS